MDSPEGYGLEHAEVTCEWGSSVLAEPERWARSFIALYLSTGVGQRQIQFEVIRLELSGCRRIMPTARCKPLGQALVRAAADLAQAEHLEEGVFENFLRAVLSGICSPSVSRQPWRCRYVG
jgi:hypothetical protein